MSLYKVTAVSVMPDLTISEPNEEIIDTVENAMFTGCTGAWEVEDAYEAFWNRLNDSWEDNFPIYKERVKVLKVEKL